MPLFSWGSGARGLLGHGDEHDLCKPKEIVEARGWKELSALSLGGCCGLALVSKGANKDCRGGSSGLAAAAATEAEQEERGGGGGGGGGGGSGSTKTLVSWGSRDHGLLLAESNENCDRLVPLPVRSAILGSCNATVLALACGWSHALAAVRLADGSLRVLSWGCNSHGQLGIDREGVQEEPSCVGALSGRRVLSLACGWRHSLVSVEGEVARKEEGGEGGLEILSFGWNKYFQLGRESEPGHNSGKVAGADQGERMGAETVVTSSSLVVVAAAAASVGSSSSSSSSSSPSSSSFPAAVASAPAKRGSIAAQPLLENQRSKKKRRRQRQRRRLRSASDGGKGCENAAKAFPSLAQRCAEARKNWRPRSVALGSSPGAGAITLRFQGRSEKACVVACGREHSVALFPESGRVFTWGRDAFGQLGRRTGDSPLPGLVTLPPPATSAVAVATGWAHTLALCALGGEEEESAEKDVKVIVGWGRNDRAQLGFLKAAASEDGCTERRLKGDGDGDGDGNGAALAGTQRQSKAAASSLPRVINVPCDANDDYPVAVACGSESSLALSAQGRVYAWGWNEHGNLGLGAGAGSGGDDDDVDRSAVVQPTPTPIPPHNFSDNPVRRLWAAGAAVVAET